MTARPPPNIFEADLVSDQNFSHLFEETLPFKDFAISLKICFQVCIAAVGVVTDICRAMQQNFGKYFKEFMELMYQALSNPNVHQSVKPQIVAAMGDAALALGRDFKQVCFNKDKKKFVCTKSNF